ncbi:MAG: PD-(D/E)XK nuclease family protein [Bdellovibrionales bacterium]
MSEAARKSLYTIAPGLPFVDELARGLWAQAQVGPFGLSDMRVFLPTRRACLHLREAFLRLPDCHGAILLPRLQPLGDIDDDEALFTGYANSGDLALPPAIAPLRRLMLLARLAQKKEVGMTCDQAALLAGALASFLDEAHIARADFTKLPALVEEQELAGHWIETVRFLEILTHEWPRILEQEGCLDPVERRNRAMDLQIAAWKTEPPRHPVIAAGSTGSMPSTALFLGAVASLPQGSVVLPGLDASLDHESWQAIGPMHPQYGMKNLLEAMDVERGEVRPWSASEGGAWRQDSPRYLLLRETMRPAEVTEKWRELNIESIPPDALAPLKRIEVDHPQEEAQVIALMLRETLEHPERTAALVTPDRGLARRVASLLARWGIEANDSAGASLSDHQIGSFLSCLLAAAKPDAEAVAWLSLLKHPLCGCGVELPVCRKRAREIELAVWRAEKPSAFPWLETLREMMRGLTAFWAEEVPLAQRIAEHVRVAELFAATADEDGAARLWKGEAGEVSALWLDEWREAAHDFPALDGESYRNLCDHLLRQQTVRSRYGWHPRLAIMGPLEARLIHFDRVILGGLNEGVWPAEVPADPWMSRPMKRRFGLPSADFRIGLAAHDFTQLVCGAAEVVLTRARRDGSSPTVPSRFLMQLDAVLRAAGASKDGQDALAAPEPWQVWAGLLDRPRDGVIRPCAPPEPRPPVAQRPCRVRVTKIGAWLRNPYAIYAEYILKLKPLEPLDGMVGEAERGTAIHEALERFVADWPDVAPDQTERALRRLLEIGHEVFAAYSSVHPHVAAFWWPRFGRAARQFIAWQIERRQRGTRVLRVEAAGTLHVGGLDLTGRADRIDRLEDGALAILDYKSGRAPTKDSVRKGWEPQLPLLALMAAEGSFGDLGHGSGGGALCVEELAYWQLGGGRGVGKEVEFSGEEVPRLMDEAKENLLKLTHAYADQQMPYRATPKPGYALRYDDYGHLARVSEWSRSAWEDAS